MGFYPQRHNIYVNVNVIYIYVNLLITLNKIWLDVFGEMMGVGGGLIPLQSLSKIQNGTGSFNFQSKELLSKFLRQQMAISKFY